MLQIAVTAIEILVCLVMPGSAGPRERGLASAQLSPLPLGSRTLPLYIEIQHRPQSMPDSECPHYLRQSKGAAHRTDFPRARCHSGHSTCPSSANRALGEIECRLRRSSKISTAHYA